MDQIDRWVEKPNSRPDLRDHMLGCKRCREWISLIESNRAVRARLGEVEIAVCDEALRLPSLAADSVPGYRVLPESRAEIGGQGIVYRAVCTSTNAAVMIKLLHKPYSAASRQGEQFEQEFRLALSLRGHPNVVAVRHMGLTADGLRYFVMDEIDGLTLDRYLGSVQPRPARHAIRGLVVPLYVQVCNAVAFAHERRITHGDLKPANVVVDYRGQAHVIDFGMSAFLGPDRFLSRRSHATVREFAGTIMYAAPEQLTGRRTGRYTDVYAIGLMLYETIAGSLPYSLRGTRRDIVDRILRDKFVAPSRLNRSVDAKLDTVVLRALAREPLSRYDSAGALERDLTQFVRGQTLANRRSSVLASAIRRLGLRGPGTN